MNTRSIVVLAGVILAMAAEGCSRKAEEKPMTPTDVLCAAARAGELAKVKELLAASPLLIRAKDDEGKTALHHAASGGRMEVVKFLLEQGADPTARDKYNITPMERAALKRHDEIAALLMREPASPEDEGEKAMYDKVKKHQQDIREQLEETSSPQ